MFADKTRPCCDKTRPGYDKTRPSEGMMEGGRITMIQSGHHRLQAASLQEPPFMADFYIEMGKRVVLRGG